MHIKTKYTKKRAWSFLHFKILHIDTDRTTRGGFFMDNRIRKVSSVMKPYIEFVLKRDEIPYKMKRKSDCWLFQMDISNRRFTEVLEDALCEKQRSRYISHIPVYSFRTLMNREKLGRLIMVS